MRDPFACLKTDGHREWIKSTESRSLILFPQWAGRDSNPARRGYLMRLSWPLLRHAFRAAL